MAWVKIADRSTYWSRSNTNTPLSADYRAWWTIYYDNQPDITNNRTKIKVESYVQAYYSESVITYVTGSSYIKLNGVNQPSVTINAEVVGGYNLKLQGTNEYWVNHNSDGTGSFTWQGFGNVEGFSRSTAASTYSLPQIPRYATINSFTWTKASGGAGLSRLTCNWSVSNTCDAVEYSLSGGGWTSSGTSGTSGSFNISGLTPNTEYSLKIRAKRTDSQLWTESGTIYQTTYDIAKITVAPNNNVDVEAPFTITYTNPSGASLQTAIYKTDASTAIAGYRGCTSTGYEYLFTVGERTAFYNQIPTTKTLPLRIYLQTSDGLGNTYLHYVERTFEVVNANPTFTNWTYADTNATTLALTGNNQKIIKGYSNVKATITSANKMVANKGATATSYQLTIGTKPSATATYSESSTVEMTVNAVDNNVFNCYAIDGRGNSTNVIKTLTTDYINYTPISITSATATRTDNIGTETTLAFSGNIFDGSFGSASNSVKTATYKFKKTTDASYTDGTSVITPTKTGGTFSFSGIIKGDEGSGGVDGFNATYSYNVQVIVTDELSTKTFNFILGSGRPSLAMHKDGIAINQAYDETLGGALQVGGDTNIDGALQIGGNINTDGDFYKNGILFNPTFNKLDCYPVGTIYENATDSTSPATLFGGGTWVALTDRFLIGAGGTYSNGSTGGSTLLQNHNHSQNSHNHGQDSHQHVATTRTTTYGQGSQSAWRCMSFEGTNSDYAQTVYTGWAQPGIWGATATNNATGGGNAENMPPWRAVYMWYRSA